MDVVVDAGVDVVVDAGVDVVVDVVVDAVVDDGVDVGVDAGVDVLMLGVGGDAGIVSVSGAVTLGRNNPINTWYHGTDATDCVVHVTVSDVVIASLGESITC